MPLERPFVSPTDANFPPTLISLVVRAADRSTPEGAEAFERLCTVYWPPLYAFLRRQGESPVVAQDYVQGFFERLTERDFLAQMDVERGRFRTFLRAALWHYVLNQRRADRTDRRGGGHLHVPIEEMAGAEQGLTTLSTGVTADEVYDREWASGLVRRAHLALRHTYVTEGKGAEFADLSVWLVKPSESGDYAEVAKRRGVTENGIAAAVKRLRREYLNCLRGQVLQTLESPAEVEAELKYLLEVLISQPLTDQA